MALTRAEIIAIAEHVATRLETSLADQVSIHLQNILGQRQETLETDMHEMRATVGQLLVGQATIEAQLQAVAEKPPQWLICPTTERLTNFEPRLSALEQQKAVRDMILRFGNKGAAIIVGIFIAGMTYLSQKIWEWGQTTWGWFR